MRIAYLSKVRVPSTDASAVQVMKMCGAFAEAGHEVTLHARPGVMPCDDPFAYYRVKQRFTIRQHERPPIELIGTAVLVQRMRRAMRTGPAPELLYAREPHILAQVAGLKVPMVFEAHEAPHAGLDRRVQDWLFRRPNFRRVVTITEALAERYRHEYPQLRDKEIVVAHSGADLPELADAASPSAGEDADERPLRVGYVGQLYPGKGMEIVVPLARALPHVRFDVIGGNPEAVTRWRREARDCANLHLHGYQPPTRTAAFYRALDVLLVPTQPTMGVAAGGWVPGKWTSPMKLFECMAHGKAIVASDLVSLREVLSHEHNALLADATTLDEWIDAVGRLEREPALRAALGEQAATDFRGSYTWQRRAQRVLQNIEAPAAAR